MAEKIEAMKEWIGSGWIAAGSAHSSAVSPDTASPLPRLKAECTISK